MSNILHQVISRIFKKKGKTFVPFKILYAEFKKCLELNNQILDQIADANDKLSGDYIFDEPFIKKTCQQLTDLVRELIVTLNHLTQQKYTVLYDSFHRIEEEMEAILSGKIISQTDQYVLPYSSVTRDLIDTVGGKNAHIAEIGSILKLQIPEGFAITTKAFSDFWQLNNLETKVAEILEDWQKGVLTLDEAATQIQQNIRSSKLPARLEKEIHGAAKVIIGSREDTRHYFAVRSSALGEDDVSSFAGQYRSCLNVPANEIVKAYIEVVSSLYSPEAIEYRLGKDFRPHEIMMSVACQLMIPSLASGVLYSYDPVQPEMETMLISSSWGLGEPIVSGKVPTDHFVIDRLPPNEIKEKNIANKDQFMVQGGTSGTEMHPVSQEQRILPSLTNSQLEQLAKIGLQIEQYFKKPQDIEFAIDTSGNIVILQSRPLAIEQERQPRACDLSGIGGKYKILMRGDGIAAMEGVATGPVWVLTEDSNLEDFPVGGILVARYASPQLAKVIHKAAGYITDIGSTTGHLATVAREFRVPALFNAVNATKLFEHGSEITLDTECLTVYEGIVSELHYYTLQEEPIEEMYEYRLLRRVLKKIEPLHLFNPQDENFKPRFCSTYHDLTRFIHEKAVETIIDLNFYHAHQRDTQAGKLLWKYPIDLILIDVGGGIIGGHEKGILPEQINSVPMQALIQGMSYPGIWDMAPMKVDFGSFMSSLTRTAATRHSSPEDVGRNLAVVSEEYTNINFRLGYHFTVVDAYLSDNILDNHVYFRFAGGVTDTTRRARRASLIGEILGHYDFLCEIHGDIIVARLKRMDKEGMQRRLFLLGLLIGFTRQLDVKMINDERIRVYFEHIKNIMEGQ